MPAERYPCVVRQHTPHTHTALARYSAATQQAVNRQLAFCGRNRGVPLILVIDSKPRLAFFYPLSVGGEVEKPFELVGMAQEIGNPLTRTGEK